VMENQFLLGLPEFHSPGPGLDVRTQPDMATRVHKRFGNLMLVRQWVARAISGNARAILGGQADGMVSIEMQRR
jgi:hypothetical protein